MASRPARPIACGLATAPTPGASRSVPRLVSRTSLMRLETGRRAAGDNLQPRVPPRGGHTSPPLGLRWRQSGRASGSVSSRFQGRMPAAPDLRRRLERRQLRAAVRRFTPRPGAQWRCTPDGGSRGPSPGRGGAGSGPITARWSIVATSRIRPPRRVAPLRPTASTARAAQTHRAPLRSTSGPAHPTAGRTSPSPGAAPRSAPLRQPPESRPATSPPGSATATAIVSAWTSRPTNRTVLMTGSLCTLGGLTASRLLS